MSITEADPINIHEPVDQICQLLGLDSTYVAELTIRPNSATVHLYRGRDGTCKGAKYVDDNGDAAMHTLDFKVDA